VYLSKKCSKLEKIALWNTVDFIIAAELVDIPLLHFLNLRDVECPKVAKTLSQCTSIHSLTISFSCDAIKILSGIPIGRTLIHLCISGYKLFDKQRVNAALVLHNALSNLQYLETLDVAGYDNTTQMNTIIEIILQCDTSLPRLRCIAVELDCLVNYDILSRIMLQRPNLHMCYILRDMSDSDDRIKKFTSNFSSRIVQVEEWDLPIWKQCDCGKSNFCCPSPLHLDKKQC